MNVLLGLYRWTQIVVVVAVVVVVVVVLVVVVVVVVFAVVFVVIVSVKKEGFSRLESVSFHLPLNQRNNFHLVSTKNLNNRKTS